MTQETIALIMDGIIRLIVLLIMPYLLSFIRKYQLEKTVRDAVLAAEKIFNDPDMGELKNIFVKEYVFGKYKIKETDLDVLIESRLEELDMIKKKLEVK
jgi:hypothetical protein